MPAPAGPILQEREESRLGIGLDPAHNLFYSLFLLSCGDKFSGLDAWVEKARARLSADRLAMNLNVISGLFGAIKPERRYESFPEYLDELEAQEPSRWIDRLFGYYERMAAHNGEGFPATPRSDLMADFELYLSYLLSGFGEERVNEAVERQAHYWINHPEDMHPQVMEHLRFMWEQELEPEWKRAGDRLKVSLDALRELRIERKEPAEAVRLASGQEPNDWLAAQIAEAEQIILVPSPHLGPYLGQLETGDTLWVLYGARVPEGSTIRSRELDRSELLMRLNALADDTRLQIMDIAAREDEVCAQEFISQLEISQSSASRHLRQLAATGLLSERRVDGAKCYRIHRDGVKAMVQSLAEFFPVNGASGGR